MNLKKENEMTTNTINIVNTIMRYHDLSIKATLDKRKELLIHLLGFIQDKMEGSPKWGKLNPIETLGVSTLTSNEDRKDKIHLYLKGLNPDQYNDYQKAEIDKMFIYLYSDIGIVQTYFKFTDDELQNIKPLLSDLAGITIQTSPTERACFILAESKVDKDGLMKIIVVLSSKLDIKKENNNNLNVPLDINVGSFSDGCKAGGSNGWPVGGCRQNDAVVFAATVGSDHYGGGGAGGKKIDKNVSVGSMGIAGGGASSGITSHAVGYGTGGGCSTGVSGECGGARDCGASAVDTWDFTVATKPPSASPEDRMSCNSELT